MGDVENWRCEVDFDGLSLIDVSVEDDSLLFSSFPDPTSYVFSDIDNEDRGLSLFGNTPDCVEEILVSDLEEKEEVIQPHQSPESQKITKSEKYNLRKSLAWDKAFFTNAGVLEPDELSSMIESNHMSQKKNLPAIQEDVNRSTESISTLQSDCTVETGHLLANVNASIQRSGRSSDAATPGKTKMKPNAIRERLSIRTQGLGKVTKQPVAAKEHNTSISRPPNESSKNIRASVDVNKVKQEKNPKLTGGKKPLVAKVPVSSSTRPIVSKSAVPFRSSLRSSVASKNELTSSCSSLESCVTVSSSASNKSSRDLAKQKKDQSLRIASHSLGNGSTFRAASKTISQPKVTPLSASRAYKSKLSSNVSPLSSSVDWSSESSRDSTPNKIPKGNQKTVPGERSPAIDDSTQTSKLLKNSIDVSTVQDDLKPYKQVAKRGSVVNRSTERSASILNPTRLRVPSPKIGFFDGSRSSGLRTPTRPCTGPGSGLAKYGSRSPNESTANRTKPGKSQTTRSPLIQESTISKAKISPVSRNHRLIVSASSSSPKLTKKMYSKVSAEEELQGQ